MPWKDIFQPELPSNEAITLLDDLLEEVQFTDKRHELLNLFRQIESGGWNPVTQTVVHPYGESEAVSGAGAKGVYQFKDENIKYDEKGNLLHSSVETAKNRAKQLGVDSSFVELIPNDPRQWTDDEADVLALANLFNQKKNYRGYVDDLLVKAFGGDREKMHKAYELHHTSLGDEGTEERLNKIIPLK